MGSSTPAGGTTIIVYLFCSIFHSFHKNNKTYPRLVFAHFCTCYSVKKIASGSLV